MNAFGMVNKLFTSIGKVTNYVNCAFSTISSELCKYVDSVSPPQYNKIGTLKSSDITEKVIWIDALPSLSLRNCNHCVSVNAKAASIMCHLYGIQTLHTIVQYIDQILVWNGLQGTMFTRNIRVLLFNISSSEMFFVQFEKQRVLWPSHAASWLIPICLLSWCGIRMAHFLDACFQIEKVLQFLYDTTMSVNIILEKIICFFQSN